MIELHTAGTANGQRSAIAVNECGVACRIHVLDLTKGDQHTPEFRKLNPRGRIPVLIDPQGPGGRELVLTQSWAILLHLAERAGRFIPTDPLARVRMYEWLMEGASDIAPTNSNIYFLGNRMPEKVPGSTIAFYENRLQDMFRTAAERLEDGPYLAGDEITVADLGLYPVYMARKALIDAGAGVTGGLQTWAERIGARPGVQKGMRLQC